MTCSCDCKCKEFKRGDYVKKVTGDYLFGGVIVAKFFKLEGMVRYVVENEQGILHIFSAKNLEEA